MLKYVADIRCTVTYFIPTYSNMWYLLILHAKMQWHHPKNTQATNMVCGKK